MVVGGLSAPDLREVRRFAGAFYRAMDAVDLNVAKADPGFEDLFSLLLIQKQGAEPLRRSQFVHHLPVTALPQHGRPVLQITGTTNHEVFHCADRLLGGVGDIGVRWQW
jgi:hypothetical protein